MNNSKKYNGLIFGTSTLMVRAKESITYLNKCGISTMIDRRSRVGFTIIVDSNVDEIQPIDLTTIKVSPTWVVTLTDNLKALDTACDGSGHKMLEAVNMAYCRLNKGEKRVLKNVGITSELYDLTSLLNYVGANVAFAIESVGIRASNITPAFVNTVFNVFGKEGISHLIYRSLQRTVTQVLNINRRVTDFISTGSITKIGDDWYVKDQRTYLWLQLLDPSISLDVNLDCFSCKHSCMKKGVPSCTKCRFEIPEIVKSQELSDLYHDIKFVNGKPTTKAFAAAINRGKCYEKKRSFKTEIIDHGDKKLIFRPDHAFMSDNVIWN